MGQHQLKNSFSRTEAKLWICSFCDLEETSLRCKSDHSRINNVLQTQRISTEVFPVCQKAGIGVFHYYIDWCFGDFSQICRQQWELQGRITCCDVLSLSYYSHYVVHVKSIGLKCFVAVLLYSLLFFVKLHAGENVC